MLVLHAGIAGFVVVGLVLIVVGNAAGWRWVNRLGFRCAHASAIAIVVAEAWLGIACPLTLLEMSLRARVGASTYGGGFVEHWLGRLLYFEAPPWVFVLAYSLFALVVAAAWCYFPPRPTRRLPAAR